MSTQETTRRVKPTAENISWVSLRPKNPSKEKEQYRRLIWNPAEMAEQDAHVQRLNNLLNVLIWYGNVELVRMQDARPDKKVRIAKTNGDEVGSREMSSDSFYDARRQTHLIALNFNTLILKAEHVYKESNDLEKAERFLEQQLNQELRKQILSLSMKELGWLVGDEVRRSIIAFAGALCFTIFISGLSEYSRLITQAEPIDVDAILKIGLMSYFVMGVLVEITTEWSNAEQAGQSKEMSYTDYIYEALEGLHLLIIPFMLVKIITILAMNLDRRALVRRTKE